MGWVVRLLAVGLCMSLAACGGPGTVNCGAPRTYMPGGTSYSWEDGLTVFAEDGSPMHGVLVEQPRCATGGQP